MLLEGENISFLPSFGIIPLSSPYFLISSFAKPGPALPLVPFGKHRITRLVAGANPIYGYSHFNYVFSAHMGEYHTTERVLSFLRELERAGLNTWQASWSERLETDWLKYKDQGGKLQLLLLSRPNFNDQPEICRAP